MMENLVFTVEYAGERLDVFLVGKLEGYSRSFVRRLIDEGLVLIGGKKEKSGYKLRPGERIEVSIEPPKEIEVEPEEMPLDIIYEDDALLVVNKPQGLVVHPAPGHPDHTLVNGLLYHCRGKLSGINGYLRPGIVHRIDRDTSGLLVAAKTNKAHLLLSEQLSAHSMTRRYEAIIIGSFKEDAGTINKAVGRHPVDRKKMCVTEKAGRHAVTHYRTLESFKGFSHIEARLETGRTHQIRVHMSFMGHPVLGDPVYGGIAPGFSLNRQALHAGILGFIHPETEEYLEFAAKPPEYFTDLLKNLRNR